MTIKGYGNAVDEQIDSFKNQIGCDELPVEYVSFLKHTNGGEIEGDAIHIITRDNTYEIKFRRFFGFVDDDKTDLRKANSDTPFGEENVAIIIGDDSIGNVFLLYPVEDKMSVFYCDINGLINPTKDSSNTYKVADSFGDLLSRMELDYLIGENENNDYVNYYPLGTVVLLKSANKRLVIIGRGLIINNDNRELFVDYVGATFPEGLLNNRVAYFNKEAIDKVLFEGFADDEDKYVVDKINVFLKEHPEMEHLDVATTELVED